MRDSFWLPSGSWKASGSEIYTLQGESWKMLHQPRRDLTILIGSSNQRASADHPTVRSSLDNPCSKPRTSTQLPSTLLLNRCERWRVNQAFVFVLSGSVESDSLWSHGLYSPPVGFSRQEFWTGLPFPSRGDLPDPGIEPKSPEAPALAGGATEPFGKPLSVFWGKPEQVNNKNI